MPFCTGCGKSLNAGVKFCTGCGKAQGPVNSSATAPKPKPKPATPSCSSCGKAFAIPKPKFCTTCGTPSAGGGGGSGAADPYTRGSSSSTTEPAWAATAKQKTEKAAGMVTAQERATATSSTGPSSGVRSRWGGGSSVSSGNSGVGSVKALSSPTISGGVSFSSRNKSGASPKPEKKVEKKPVEPVKRNFTIKKVKKPPPKKRETKSPSFGSSLKKTEPVKSSSTNNASTSVPSWAATAREKTEKAAAATGSKACPKCGTHNSGTRFCISCGEQLESMNLDIPRASRVVAADGKYVGVKNCTNCGKKMGSKFCTSCGMAAGASAPPGKAPPGPPSASTATKSVPTSAQSPSQKTPTSCAQCKGIGAIVRGSCSLCGYNIGDPIKAAKPQCLACGAKKSGYFCPSCGHKDRDDASLPKLEDLDRMRNAAKQEQTTKRKGIPGPPPKKPIPAPPPKKDLPAPPSPATPPALPKDNPPSNRPASRSPQPEKKGLRGTLRSWKKSRDASLKKPLDMQAVRAQYGPGGSETPETGAGEVTSAAPAAEVTPSPASGSGGRRSWAKSRDASLKKPLDMKALRAQYGQNLGEESETGEGEAPTAETTSSARDPAKRRTWAKRYDTIKTGEIEAAKAAAAGAAGVPAASDEPQRKTFMTPGLSPRERAVLEIIDTEEDYVKDLAIIVDVFLTPCRASTGVKMSAEDVQAIFSNIELIRGVNETLLEKFRACDYETGAGIGAAFVSMAPYLRMYSTFCSNQATMFATIEKLKADTKKTNWESFLQYCFARQECRNLDFNSFMIKPMQRVTKYPLLLRELIKNTDDSHPEHKSLLEADKEVGDIVLDINEKSKAHESGVKMVALSQKLHGGGIENFELVTPTRRIEREQELYHYASSGKHKPGFIYIFNDLIVYTKKTRRGFMLKAWIPLSGASVNAAPDFKEPTFELHSPATCYKPWPLACKSPAERSLLMDLIQDLIDQCVGATLLRDSRESLNPDSVGVSPEIQELPLSNASTHVSFSCTYEDTRVVEVPRRQAVSLDALSAAVAETFEVPAVTLFFQDELLEDDFALQSLVAHGDTFDLAVYDPY